MNRRNDNANDENLGFVPMKIVEKIFICYELWVFTSSLLCIEVFSSSFFISLVVGWFLSQVFAIILGSLLFRNASFFTEVEGIIDPLSDIDWLTDGNDDDDEVLNDLEHGKLHLAPNDPFPSQSFESENSESNRFKSRWFNEYIWQWFSLKLGNKFRNDCDGDVSIIKRT